MTEKELQEAVWELAWLLGYRLRYHTFDSRRSSAGFPDLVLVRLAPYPRLMFVELKVPPNRVTAEQTAWLEGLRRVGVEVHVWTPEDWVSGAVEASLR